VTFAVDDVVVALVYVPLLRVFPCHYHSTNSSSSYYYSYQKDKRASLGTFDQNSALSAIAIMGQSVTYFRILFFVVLTFLAPEFYI
jgi:hypothetical protein